MTRAELILLCRRILPRMKWKSGMGKDVFVVGRCGHETRRLTALVSLTGKTGFRVLLVKRNGRTGQSGVIFERILDPMPGGQPRLPEDFIVAADFEPHLQGIADAIG